MLKRIALACGLLLFAETSAYAACPATAAGTISGSNAIALQAFTEAICAALDTLSGGGATGLALTDASIASASGASQTVAAASATRKALILSNPAATTWWINPSGGTASANCAGCFELPPGAYWSPKPAPTNAVTGIGTAASKLTVAGG
jgi:hypothetical protein